MKPKKILILCAALAVSGQAFAFQETTAGRAVGGKEAPAAAPAADLTVPATPARTPGTEIRVPGLGTIGALPKLDFGLELLYGAGEPKGAREEVSKEPSDLQIRGTLKYRFPTN